MSTAERMDETASLAHFVCPDHHYLESLGRRRTGLGPREPDAADHSAAARDTLGDREPVGLGRQNRSRRSN